MPAIDAGAEALVSPEEIEADLALLRGAAEEAGRIALAFFRNKPEVWMKTGNSPVSEADLAANLFLKDALLTARPDYGWLSEETADTPERLTRRRTFVVDPIDGTRAFIDGRDVWCVSVAVVERGRPIAGVLDCPAKGEVFWSGRGAGAFKNGARIGVSPASDAPRIGGPKPLIERLPESLRGNASHAGAVPSLAYRIGMVAEGTMDASFVKPNAHDWDIAAAMLVLAEAGGELRAPDGHTPLVARADPVHGPLAAGHGPLLEAMTSVLSTATLR